MLVLMIFSPRKELINAIIRSQTIGSCTINGVWSYLRSNDTNAPQCVGLLKKHP